MAVDHHAVAAEEQHHPGWQEYVKIGVVLSIITAIEVAIVYIDALDDVLLWILLALSAVKFALVVAFYMHLKFDNKFFTVLFVAGLLTAGGIVLSLMAMFGLMS